MSKPYYLVPNFSKKTGPLKDFFRAVFEDPRKAPRERFLWDPWYLPHQYYQLRTPGDVFFPKKILHPLKTDLKKWGAKNINCKNISPLWLSLYLEGHFQEIHADHPHGPWAFVLPLQNMGRTTEGGETFISKPKEFIPSVSNKTNEGERFEWRIKPQANRLLVFDPSLPHGVKRVSGARDPLKGRLVLHGWFQK